MGLMQTIINHQRPEDCLSKTQRNATLVWYVKIKGTLK